MSYPGRLLHRIAARCCPADCERVFEPLIADFQREWTTLDNAPRRVRALTLLRGYGSFWESLIVVTTRALLRETLSLPSAEFAARAGMAFAIGLLGAVVIEFALVFSTGGRIFFGVSTPVRVFWASTRALILGIPLGMLPALLYARARSRRGKPSEGIKLTIGAALLTIAVVGWIAPLAQRKFDDEAVQRKIMATAPRSVILSPIEATWPTLVSLKTENPYVAAELQRRTGLVGLTAALALLGWTLGALGREHRAHAVMWWAMAWLLTFLTQNQAAVSVVASWLPVLVFALAAVALRLLARFLPGPDPPARPAPPAPPALPAL